MARRKPQARNYKLDHQLTTTTKDLIGSIHDYDVDLKSNHIYLMNREIYAGVGTTDTNEPGIEHTIASRFIRNINLCM